MPDGQVATTVALALELTDGHLDGHLMSVARSYSIAQAKDQLARLVREAETGKPVELTRRGKPVAVVVSFADYARMQGRVPSLWERLSDFRETEGLEDLENVFGDVRDTSAGRDVEVD
ncbi:MAG: type II toxin-antitoxin system Phd/YefM family antitoxin [Proteobacteria bacterium]|nr:type II toxin-antitoxin system Phd/YefM family antitoxin [Pseudomonadota bacterium]